MNQSITRLTLDVSVQEKQASISVRQLDTMRRLVFSIVDRGLPYIFEKGVYAAISVNTSPVTSLFGGCVIKDGAVHYDLDTSLTLEPNEFSCDLILYASDGRTLTACSFDLIVFASNAAQYAPDAVLSNEYSAMLNATANANDAAELARDAEEDAYKATSRANEISQTLEDKLAAGEFKGERGEQGPVGLQGPQGDKGDKGDQGDKGDKGDKGDPGATGAKGEKGDKGDKGDQGIQGIQGEKGDKGDPGEGVPPVTDADKGKVLTAGEDGTAKWKEPTGGETIVVESFDELSQDDADGAVAIQPTGGKPSGTDSIEDFETANFAKKHNGKWYVAEGGVNITEVASYKEIPPNAKDGDWFVVPKQGGSGGVTLPVIEIAANFPNMSGETYKLSDEESAAITKIIGQPFIARFVGQIEAAVYMNYMYSEHSEGGFYHEFSGWCYNADDEKITFRIWGSGGFFAGATIEVEEVIDFTTVFDFVESVSQGGIEITREYDGAAAIKEKMKNGPVKLSVAFNQIVATKIITAQYFPATDHCQFTDFVVYENELLYMYLQVFDHNLFFRCKQVTTTPYYP